jgi:hypothetical protein
MPSLTAACPPSFRDVLGVRGMTGYYTAATLARVGDEMVALILLVLDRTDSPALAGITGAEVSGRLRVDSDRAWQYHGGVR